MSYGFQAINDFGTIQIDENLGVLQVESKGQYILYPAYGTAEVFIPKTIFNFTTSYLYINYDLGTGVDFSIYYDDTTIGYEGTYLTFDGVDTSFLLNYLLVKKSYELTAPVATGYGLIIKKQDSSTAFNSNYDVVNNLVGAFISGTGPYQGYYTATFAFTVPIGKKLFFDSSIFVNALAVWYINPTTLRVRRRFTGTTSENPATIVGRTLNCCFNKFY
jgi:hypothetical protein